MSTPAATDRSSRVLGAVGAAVTLAALVFFVTQAHPQARGTGARVATLAALLLGSAVAFGIAARTAPRDDSHAGGARSLAAGAVAAGYFTLHAAHAVPALRVVDDPVAAGALLGAAAVAGALAARRYRARGLGALAALLALAAVLVPPLSTASLVAAAVLVTAAFVFLVPDAWRPVPQAMLVLAHAALAAERLVRNGWVAVPYPSRADVLTGAAFLAVVATACAWPVWRSDAPVFRERERAAVLVLGLALAWPLAALLLPRGEPRALAAALGASGAWLLAVRALVKRRQRGFPLLRSAATTPALVALTAAAAAFVFPPAAPLPVLLALSGMGLAMAAEYVGSVPLRGATLLVSLAAAALGATTADASAALLCAAVLAYTAFFVDRHREPSNAGSAFFAAAAAAVALLAVLGQAAPARQPLAAAVLGLGLSLAGRLACVHPLAAAGQVPVAAAYVLFLRQGGHAASAGLTLAVLVAAAWTACAWWRSLVAGRVLRAVRRAATALHGIATAAAAFVALTVWLPADAPAAWLTVPALAALAAAGYAVLARDPAFGAAWQALLLLAVAQFAVRGTEVQRLLAAGGPRPSPGTTLALLAPVAALFLLAALADGRLLGRPLRGGWAGGTSAVARAAGAAMLVAWCAWHVPPALQFAALEALAVAWLVHAARRNDATGVALSTLVSTGAVWLFWRAAPAIAGLQIPALVGFALLLVQQQLWRHRYPHVVPAALHAPAMVLGIGSLWRFAHVTTAALAGPSWTPSGWAAVGAVACALGIVRREPTYRLLGLGVLAAALARTAGLGPSLSAGTRGLTAAAIGLLVLGLAFAYERVPGPDEPREVHG